MFVGLSCLLAPLPIVIQFGVWGCTYKRHATVSTPAYLRLVEIDEDSRMAKRATAAVTRDGAPFTPAHGLLVDEVDGGKGSWL